MNPNEPQPLPQAGVAQIIDQLRRFGWMATNHGSWWRVQMPWMPEFAGEGETLRAAILRLARSLRYEVETLETIADGGVPL